jgi:hypothetical protein
MISIHEFVARHGSVPATAAALGVHDQQVYRWIKMGAIIVDGEIYTPAQRHRDARKYKLKKEAL